jgi:hypothetical protein
MHLRRARAKAILDGMETDELQHALGGVVLESGYLERMLRAAFCALTGSKYAVVAASQMMTSGLIEQCRHIATVHTDIGEAHKRQLAEALEACKRVNDRRNRVIHDTWASRPGDVTVTLRSKRSSHQVRVMARTLGELRQLADEIGLAADELGAVLAAALGADSLLIEDQLRQELGHDISTDQGS